LLDFHIFPIKIQIKLDDSRIILTEHVYKVKTYCHYNRNKLVDYPKVRYNRFVEIS